MSLGLSGDRQEIGANETLNITLKGQYSDGTQKNINEGVQWLSNEPRVATIDDQGRVTARQAGETKITARYRDMVSPAWTVAVRAEKPVLTVTAPAEKPVTKTPVATKLAALTVSPGNREIKIQERLLLRVKARYSDGNERGLSSGVEWRSSDSSVATVDVRGELRALRAGKIAVVARWGGIESLAVDIIVKEPASKPPPAPHTRRRAASSAANQTVQCKVSTLRPTSIGRRVTEYKEITRPHWRSSRRRAPSTRAAKRSSTRSKRLEEPATLNSD